jgi:hypothetical protein
VNAKYRSALIEKYRRDFQTFAADCLRIKTARPGEIVPLRLNASQRRILQLEEEQRTKQEFFRIVILKHRQMGGSTLCAARAFHAACLTKNFASLVIAQNTATTSHIFNMYRLFLSEMPEWIRPMVRYDSKTEMSLENPKKQERETNPGLRSKLLFQTAGNLNAGTGTTLHSCHISEAGKFTKQDTDLLVASLLPAVHMVAGTMISIESTAFLYGDWFREMTEMARSGQSAYTWAFIPWFMAQDYALPLDKGEDLHYTAEERQIAALAKRGQKDDNVPPIQIRPEQFKWRRQKILEFIGEFGEDLFYQEYPSTYEEAWVRLDTQFFSKEKLRALRKGILAPKRFLQIQGSEVKEAKGRIGIKDEYIALWKEPQEGHVYDLGVDTALGEKNSDYSVCEIFDRDTHEQVAEYRKRIDLFELADEIVALAWYFTRGSGRLAQIGPEVDDYGLVMIQRLHMLEYPNLYRWRHRDRDTPSLSVYTGWKTQTDSKKVLLGQMHHMVQAGQILIHSSVLLDEMHNFIRCPTEMGETARAGRGHDDCVMAASISIIIGVDESYGKKTHDDAPVVDRKAQLEREVQKMVADQITDNRDFERDSEGGRVLDNYVRETKGWP